MTATSSGDAAHSRLADRPPVPSAERWPRPDELDLELSVELTSRTGGLDEQYGWQLWQGTITAGWEWSPPEGEPPLPPQARGLWDAEPTMDYDGECQRLRVGRLERRVLPLGDEALCQGHLPPVRAGAQLWEAGDELSASLEEVTSAVCGDGPLFSDEVYEVSGAEWIDHLIVLESVELVPEVRGWGVGAWASATSIAALTRGPSTLLVTKAAPLWRTPFMGDDDARDMTDDEDAAWAAVQDKIRHHWQTSLGLRPLPGHPEILVANGFIDAGGPMASACRWDG